MAQLSPTKVIRAKGVGSPRSEPNLCCSISRRHIVIPPTFSRRATNLLVRLVEGEERWEAPDHPERVLPQNWGETELNSSVTCIVLKATANDRRHLALCHDEIHGH
ncbi:uncharacterized protein TNCV_409381 [Trichonephila clavipes]|nr:uncharacterized protein TNCV_409381 [Trichonephila clavipes]